MVKKDILLFSSPPPRNIKKSSILTLIAGLKREGDDNYRRVEYHDIVVHLAGPTVQSYIQAEGKQRLLKADLVYLQGFSQPDVRQFIAHYCKDKKLKLLNTENTLTSPASKLNQYYSFSKNSVPYPETVVCYPPNIKTSIDFFKFRYPLIIKSINGRGGSDNHLVDDSTKLKRLLKKLDKNQAYAVQHYIENSGDYRVIVYKNKIVACYLRSRANRADHRNNVRRGASRRLIHSIPYDISKVAVQAAASLNRELTGVDILLDSKNKCYVLESNFNFGLSSEGYEVAGYVARRLAPILHDEAQ